MKINGIYLRRSVNKSDTENIRRIVTSTGFFNDEEIEVAVELAEEYLLKGEASGYQFVFAENDYGKCIGYSCYGRIPGTKSSYALYWIAVLEEYRNRGIGKTLLNVTESEIIENNGTGIYVETSSRDQYGSTRVFYSQNGYEQKARFEDYYDTGDDLVFFVKKLN